MVRGMRRSAHLTVASTIFFGKSSAPTSPATDKASPPAALISASTVSKRFASILVSSVSRSVVLEKWDVLADDHLSAFLCEKEGYTSANTLVRKRHFKARLRAQRNSIPGQRLVSHKTRQRQWDDEMLSVEILTSDDGNLSSKQAASVRVREVSRNLLKTVRHDSESRGL